MRTDTAPIRVDRARLKAASDRGTLLSLWGELCPDTPAVISDAGVRTFRELNARSNRLSMRVYGASFFGSEKKLAAALW